MSSWLGPPLSSTNNTDLACPRPGSASCLAAATRLLPTKQPATPPPPTRKNPRRSIAYSGFITHFLSQDIGTEGSWRSCHASATRGEPSTIRGRGDAVIEVGRYFQVGKEQTTGGRRSCSHAQANANSLTGQLFCIPPRSRCSASPPATLIDQKSPTSYAQRPENPLYLAQSAISILACLRPLL